MSFLKLATIFASLVIISGKVNICHKPGVNGVQFGKRLLKWTFINYPSQSLTDCSMLCQRHKLCVSVNFNSVTSICELNANNTGLSEIDVSFTFVDVQQWPTNVLGPCADKPCQLHQVCQTNATSPDDLCVTLGCLRVPNQENVNATSFRSKILWKNNEQVHFACKKGYYPSTNPKCGSDGDWNVFQCRPFTNCEDVEEKFMAKDGDYIIRPFANQSAVVKVYCEFDEGKIYVSLTKENIASFSSSIPDVQSHTPCDFIESPLSFPKMGETRFNKIRININEYYIVKTNWDFANSTGYNQQFGSAGDCSTTTNGTCGINGFFSINLKGTGIRLGELQWKKWENQTVQDIWQSADGLQVNGSCGGHCGGCQIRGTPPIIPDPSYVPSQDEESLIPYCNYI